MAVIWPISVWRNATRTPAPRTECVVQKPATPSRGAVVIVVVLLLTSTTMFLAGYPVGAVLGLVAGSCGIAIETVRRLSFPAAAQAEGA